MRQSCTRDASISLHTVCARCHQRLRSLLKVRILYMNNDVDHHTCLLSCDRGPARKSKTGDPALVALPRTSKKNKATEKEVELQCRTTIIRHHLDQRKKARQP